MCHSIRVSDAKSRAIGAITAVVEQGAPPLSCVRRTGASFHSQTYSIDTWYILYMTQQKYTSSSATHHARQQPHAHVSANRVSSPR